MAKDTTGKEMLTIVVAFLDMVVPFSYIQIIPRKLFPIFYEATPVLKGYEKDDIITHLFKPIL